MFHDVVAPSALIYSRRRGVEQSEALIKAHSQMVRRIAWHVHSRMSSVIEVADLVQIGLIALVEAARTFEDRGLAFGPYASTRIRGAMIDQLRKDARICRSGMANRRKLAATRTVLEGNLCRRATDAEMAGALDLSMTDFLKLAQTAQAVELDSLDEVYNDHDPWFCDAQERVDVMMEKEEVKVSLETHVARLSEREQLILQLYYVEELNLDEIGLILNVGAARVCQIKKVALNALRTSMGESEPE
jgi:RNA polymerase sigma factor FliA